MPKHKDDDVYSERETVRRRDEAIKRALNTPPKHHKDMIKERKRDRSRPTSKTKP